MSEIWHKVRFDVWGNKGRSLLVIFSIAAGIFAVGAIFGMVDQLLSGMDAAHLEINPSHLNVILRDYIPEETVDDLREIPGVEDIEPVNQITVRYKLNPEDDWELGALVERSDYGNQTYDLLALKEGEWPKDGGFAVERMSGSYFGIELGSEVILDVRGAESTYEITGVIRHPFVEPPPFGGQAHFFTDAQGLAEFGIPEGYFGQLLVRVADYSEQEVRRVAGEIRSTLAEQGVGVVVTIYQDPDAHWGRMFVEGVTLVLQVMAIVSLFLSVVIVFNTMTALITQQTDQIGVIKAIGGGRGTIMRIYLSEVLIFSLIALLFAVPLSLGFAYFVSRNFLNLFNIDYDAFQFSSRALVIQILTGMIVPLTAALWPVLKGAMITVREAISSYGLGSDFGSSRFDQLIERFGAVFLPTIYAASLGNMFRRKGRLVLTLLVLTIAGVMFLVTMSLVSSINFTLDNETARQQYDIRIGLAGSQSSVDVQALLEDMPDIDEAQEWFSRNVTILRDGERLEDSAGLGAQLIGIPAGEALYEPIITDGRWLESDDYRTVVLSEETAEMNDIAIGDIITLDLGDLGDGLWQVVGTYRMVYGTGFDVEPIYAPLEAMRSATGTVDQINQLLITAQVADLAEESELLDELITLFEEADIQVDFFTTAAKLEERDYADNQFSTVITMLVNLSMLIAVVGGIGLMGSLGISVVERRREIGVMRAIGAGSGSIRGIMILEGVLQGLLSFIVAVPLAYLLAQPLARALGQTMLGIDLDYAFNYPMIIIWLLAILMIAVIASIIPSRSATRVSVRESLAYG
jgi:putative ABC transport system permease protein